MAFEFGVFGPGGPLCDVRVSDEANLSELQSVIQAQTDIDPRSQRLFSGLRELRSGSSLADQLGSPCGRVEVLLVRRPEEQVGWLRELESQQLVAGNWLASRPDAALDREVVLAAVASNGMNLQYAAEKWKADREIVLAAMATSFGMALQYAVEELRADRDIVLAAVATTSGRALQDATQQLRANREFVLAATAAVATSLGTALQYAAEELRADREFVLAVMARNGMALRYAADTLRADREIVLAAMATSSGMALEYAAEELQADRELVLAAMAKNSLVLFSDLILWLVTVFTWAIFLYIFFDSDPGPLTNSPARAPGTWAFWRRAGV